MKSWVSAILFIHFIYCFECKSNTLESIIGFGDSLFACNDFSSASREFQRALFFANSDLKFSLSLKIADCYLNLSHYKAARAFYDSAIFYSGTDNQRVRIEFQKILCFIMENNFGYARIKLNQLDVGNNSLMQLRKNLYLGICCFGLGDYDSSYTYFGNSILKNDTIRQSKLIKLYQNKRGLKKPSSFWAGMSSLIIPGTGQVLSGDIKNGINSLLLLSGIICLGTLVPANNIVIIFPLFLRYYIGGIVHAVEIADNRREDKRSAFYSDLMEILFE